MIVKKKFLPFFNRITPVAEGESMGKGLGSTLARAADTIRVALLGEKADDPNSSSGRQFSTEDFELLPSEERDEQDRRLEQSQEEADFSENKKKFPPYQPASFRSWRMNLPAPLRYEPTLRVLC